MVNSDLNVTEGKEGSVSFVGIGMCLGSHITPLSKSYIQNADICFVAVSDALVEQWVFGFNKNCVSLQSLYSEGKSRNKTYAEMEKQILDKVTQGLKVCCVFYGHPGIFAKVPHQVIRKTKKLGLDATMEPGISAEDTLYADLGIDPGEFGCQHYEATHLLMYEKMIDTSSYLILWQIGLTGDLQFSNFKPNQHALKALIELLQEKYPKTHKLIIYEARTLPLEKVRSETVVLANLDKVELHPYSTLVIPPAHLPRKNEKFSKFVDKTD